MGAVENRTSRECEIRNLRERLLIYEESGYRPDRRTMKSLGIEAFENLHSLEPAEAVLKGVITILGASHHAWFIRVQQVGEGMKALWAVRRRDRAKRRR